MFVIQHWDAVRQEWQDTPREFEDRVGAEFALVKARAQFPTGTWRIKFYEES